MPADYDDDDDDGYRDPAQAWRDEEADEAAEQAAITAALARRQQIDTNMGVVQPQRRTTLVGSAASLVTQVAEAALAGPRPKRRITGRPKIFGVDRTYATVLNAGQRVRLLYLAKMQTLTRATIKVLRSMLLAFTGTTTGLCYPAHATVAEAVDCHPETVRRALDALATARFVEWVHRFKMVEVVEISPVTGEARTKTVAHQTSNQYRWLLPPNVGQTQESGRTLLLACKKVGLANKLPWVGPATFDMAVVAEDKFERALYRIMQSVRSKPS